MRIDEFRRLSSGVAPVAFAETSPSPAGGEVFVAYPELAEHGINYSRVHLRRLITRGLFPSAVMLSPNRIAWRLSDLDRWKASRPTAPSGDAR
jgi:predicted DNA-binding transcriptional regulator AlpA